MTKFYVNQGKFQRPEADNISLTNNFSLDSQENFQTSAQVGKTSGTNNSSFQYPHPDKTITQDKL